MAGDEGNGSPATSSFLADQERELQRLRQQLARLKRAARSPRQGGGRGGGEDDTSRRSSGSEAALENYVVEKRHSGERRETDGDPDVWLPPPPPPPQQRQSRGGGSGNGIGNGNGPGSTGGGGSNRSSSSSPCAPGSFGPIGRRPAVLSHPGGGVTLYPGGGGPGGGVGAGAGGGPALAAAGAAAPLLMPWPPPPLPPSSLVKTRPLPAFLAAAAVAFPPQDAPLAPASAARPPWRLSFDALSAPPPLPPPPPSSSCPSFPHAPPPRQHPNRLRSRPPLHAHAHAQAHAHVSSFPTSLLPPPHNRYVAHNVDEDTALLAALERDVSASCLPGAPATASSAGLPSSCGPPLTRWEDIAGLGAAKAVLQEAAVLPLLAPGVFTGIRRPPKGVLLHGPPGTGKTMLARAVACEAGMGGAGCCFLSASAATLASKYRGESERLVRALFTLARARAPAVIFLDEIDALCGRRGADGEHEASRRFKAELLVQIDACAAWAEQQQQQQQVQQQQVQQVQQVRQQQQQQHVQQRQHTQQQRQQQQPQQPAVDSGATPRHVLVLAATNTPWDLDEALRRRLEKRVHVPLPDAAERRELLALCLRGLDSTLTPGDLDALARRLAGFSCDDVCSVSREAALGGVRRRVAGKTPAEVRELLASAPPSSSSSSFSSSSSARPSGAVVEAVSLRDFEEALARVRPSVSAADAARHAAWSKEFGSA